MIQLRNDKYNFTEWSVDDREAALEKVFADEGGEENAIAVFDRECELYDTFGDLTQYDWDDVDDVDELADNAGCSVYQALVDLAALTYVNDDGISWVDAIDDVLEQIS